MGFYKLKLPTNTKSRNILIASIFLGIMIVLSFLFESYLSYKQEIRSAEIQSSNLSQVLEEQLLSSFKKIDLVLEDVQDTLQHKDDVHHLTGNIDAFLLEHKKRLAEALTIKVFDKDGNLIGDDMGLNPKVNIADREYFQELKNKRKDTLVISKPLVSKTMGIWVIAFSRPVILNDGRFNGAVVTTVSVDYYQKLFAKVNVGKKGSIALFGNDLTVFNRMPLGRPGIIGSRISPEKRTLNFVNSAKASDIYVTYSVVDGYKKIYSSRKLENYPLFISVGLTLAEQLESWKLRTIIYVITIFISFVTFMYFLVDFLRSIEMLEEQRKLSIQSAKLTALGEMASNIAHEINNPLTVISTMAMITKFPEPENEKEIKFNSNINKIIQTVERIAKIVQSLRTFSRDSYNDPIVPTSVQTILNTVFELCLERLKNNQVNVQVDPFTDVLVNCREYQIVQVLMNLLNNSLDAMEGQNEKNIFIKISMDQKLVRILVQDTGPKIAEDVIEKMMNPFYTTKEMGKGTGLGLSISKGIIENHKGHFYYDKSQPLTTFVIELPRID
jgi:signal transduction histidine kinase